MLGRGLDIFSLMHGVCTLLTGATGQPGAYFGQGSGPIHLDYVLCSGTEYKLTDCETGNRTRLSSHSEDVGVKCQTSKIMGLRISIESKLFYHICS